MQCIYDNMASRSVVSQRVAGLRKNQLRLQRDKTATLRRLEEDYNDRLRAVSEEMHRWHGPLTTECLAKASRDRRIELEQWKVSGDYVFRENPFYESVWSTTMDKKSDVDTENPKKRALTDAAPPNNNNNSVITLDTLITLPESALSAQIFMALGPMELFAVYCTSRCMRRALQQTLSACICNCLARLHSDQKEGVISIVNNAMVSTLGAYDSLCSAMNRTGHRTMSEDIGRVIPVLLEAMYRVDCALSSIMIENPRVYLMADALIDPSRTFILSPSQPETTPPRFPYITPLMRCNIFFSDKFVHVYMALIARYTQVYGEAQCAPVAEDPLAYFEEEDWLDLDLEPFLPDWSLVQRGHLFVIDVARGTIKALGSLDGHGTYTGLSKPTGPSCNDTFTMVIALPLRNGIFSHSTPDEYFIDHYAVRRALQRVLFKPSTNITDHEVAVIEPTPQEYIDLAINRALKRMATLHQEWRDDTGAERLDLPLSISIHITLDGDKDDDDDPAGQYSWEEEEGDYNDDIIEEVD